MSIIAALDYATLLPMGTIVAAIAAVVFAALKFNREDAGKVVSQQSAILTDMKVLNEQLHLDLARALGERDALLNKLTDCDLRIEQLTSEIIQLRADIRDLESRMGV